MTKEKAIKLQAKKHLQNNWPAAVGATLTLLLAFMTGFYLFTTIYSIILNIVISVDKTLLENYGIVFVGIMFLLIVTGVILTLPFLTGLMRYCYLLSKNSVCDYSEMFYYITKKRYFRTIFLNLGILMRNFFQAVLSFLPAGITLLSATGNAAMKDNLDFKDYLWYYIGYALLFAGILLFYILTKHNFLAIYYYIEDDNLTASQACRLSQSSIYGLSGNVTKLIISLLPVMLLCILIIPCVFVIPYVLVAQATSAKWMIALSYKDEN